MKFITFTLCLGLLACGGGDSDTSGHGGPYTLQEAEGISFVSGKITEGGSFDDSDLWTAWNGSGGLQLYTGGRKDANGKYKSTDLQPVNWFKKGGIYQTFSSLTEVPLDAPSDQAGLSLPHAKTGNAFILKNRDGVAYTRGFIVSATDESLTIDFDFPDL